MEFKIKKELLVILLILSSFDMLMKISGVFYFRFSFEFLFDKNGDFITTYLFDVLTYGTSILLFFCLLVIYCFLHFGFKLNKLFIFLWFLYLIKLPLYIYRDKFIYINGDSSINNNIEVYQRFQYVFSLIFVFLSIACLSFLFFRIIKNNISIKSFNINNFLFLLYFFIFIFYITRLTFFKLDDATFILVNSIFNIINYLFLLFIFLMVIIIIHFITKEIYKMNKYFHSLIIIVLCAIIIWDLVYFFKVIIKYSELVLFSKHSQFYLLYYVSHHFINYTSILVWFIILVNQYKSFVTLPTEENENNIS